MANDDNNIPTPKRGAFPVPKDVLENAKPFRPDKDKFEGDSPGSSSNPPSETNKKPDERNEQESPPPE